MIWTEGFRSAPGCCLACGTSTSPHGVVDLQRPDITVNVRIFQAYLCGTCALEAGRLAAKAVGKAIVDQSRLDESVPVADFLAMVERANAAEARVALVSEAVQA